MTTRSSSYRQNSFFSSTRRLTLIAIIVFGVAFAVGYTATAAAPSAFQTVFKTNYAQTDSQQAQKSRLVFRNHRDLNQPLLAHSLVQMFEAKVTTDKADYRPGETAIITGSGFWPNEIVTLQVVHIDGSEEGGAGHEPWNVAADSEGNFTSSWFVNPDDSLGATFLLTALGNSSGLTAQTTFTDKPAANLDQCANGGVGDPAVQCIGSAWQNGNLNDQQAHYLEGQTVPYRAVFTDLTAGATYTATIQYDTTQSGDHATDYLMTFNVTELNADPCTGVTGVPSCAAPNTFPIPLDPNVAGAGVTQTGGQNFTIYNGSITLVSAYTLTGTYAGTSKTSIVVTFTPTADGTAVIAWGGHISTRLDWGVANSAIAIDGSPYHMRLIDFTCSNVANCNVGNQDRSLSASAIFFPATLNITKVTVPSPQTTPKLFGYTATGTDVSNFSLDDDPNTVTSNTKSFSLSNTSSRTISEDDPSPEFTFTDLMCNQIPDPQLNDTGTVNINLGTRSVTVTPAEGETINCTYVNTQDGKIIVKKETIPDGDSQIFNFTANYDLDGFSLSDGQQNDSGFLTPGNYSVSETVPTGWDMTSSCVSSKGDNESAGSISLQAGETVTCTFTNTKRGKIIVEKQTNPDGATGSFTFTGDAAGTISDGQTIEVANLAPGTYTSTENNPAPAFDLTSITCDDANSSGNTGTRTATFNVEAGETVKCTFTNTQRGKIIVEKQTNPDGATGSFTFTGDAAGTISDGQTIEVANLAPGTYTSTENDPAPAFDLTNITCDDANSSGNTGTRTATFNVEAGETVKCTFTNTQRGKIIVEKQTNPDGATGSFTFTGDAAGTISDGQTIEVANLVPGTYTSTENDPAPAFDLTNITCDDANSSGNVGTRTATFNVEAGETVKCTFTNTKRGKIIVEKQTNPDGATGSFTFTGDAAGTISDGQTIEVANLVPGTYTSTENNPAPAFDLTNITCDDANSSGNVGTRTATFTVEAGETVKCTFTNTKRGKIIVEKQTNPDGAAGSFTFTGDAAGTISDGQTIEVDNVVPGTYTSTENNPAPTFDLTNITCDDANSSGNVGTRTATFNVEAGETVKCTFTNTKRGKIIVEKQTNPDGAAGSFTFTGDAAGTISDGQTIEVDNVVPGTYSSTENDPAPAFDLTNITCDDANSSGNVGTRTATFNVEAGETVKCTFTNTQRGKIIVEKQTNPDGATGSFTFTGDAAGMISDGQTIEVANLVPGTYTSTENDPAPAFDLTNITCDDANSSGNVGTRTATFNVEAGETVKCTFTNTQRGKIIVEKQTNPDGATGSFTFTGDAAGTISDGQTIEVANLVPGTYTSTENDPAPAFDLTNITCDDANSSGNVGTRTATFTVEAGETVKCTFTNTKRGKIIVEKQTNPDGATGSFTFTGDAAGTISDGQTIEVANLVPGTYTSTENNPAPAFDLTNITCDDANSSGNVGTRTATFNVEAGETVKCTFTNTQRGTIIVEKQTTPDGASGSFTFTGTAAGTISDGQNITVSNLVPGTYYSTENDPTPNFDLTSIVCNDANSTGDTTTRKATFRLEAGETVKCTFTNTQRGMVEVLKITNGGAHPELDIRFTLYRDGPDLDPDLTNTDVELETLSTFGDADGLLQFTEKLVPGTKYTVCENPVPAGWTSLWMITFSEGGNIVTPYNPNANDMPAQDLGIRCFDFTVTPAQTKSFEVHNDFPGGDPRTIGYWKNWNQCTGGGQAANAAKNGGPEAGFFILENLLPQLIGDFNVDTCQKGIKILGKQDQSGKSKASDAAYELAAQLLAAKLNLAAGAETCPAVQLAVMNGQALLDMINFTGSGDYLGSKVKGPLAAKRTEALGLANTLDQYNNGNLCP